MTSLSSRSWKDLVIREGGRRAKRPEKEKEVNEWKPEDLNECQLTCNMKGFDPFRKDNVRQPPSRFIPWGTFFLLVVLLSGCGSADSQQQAVCRESDLVLYRLVLETHWTRKLFPKQCPEKRHWSKMIGMTHDEQFVLFRVGEVADKPFKTFAETGKTGVLGGRRRGGVEHVLDEFSTSSIKNGAGKTRVNFFADGNHSMVSLAVKIIPSPDWFVGVDSLALCVGGNWLDSITIEAAPIDAGTDSGITFTAPNWATDPQERISEITSTWPKHPANSFNYPRLRDLPVIATFRIVKKKLYRLKSKVDVGKRQNATQTPRTDVHR